MVFGRVAVGAGKRHRFGNGHSAMFAAQLQDLCRELVKVTEDQPLAFDLCLEPLLLLLQRVQEKLEPRLPVGGSCAQRGLRLRGFV